MRARDRALWALALIVCVLLLLAPALWNGFPLLQYDTGGYLARWYEGILVPSRAVVYGLILNAGTPLSFWPVLLLQSALTVWIVALTLRAHRLGGRPILLTGIIAALSVVTTLPWLTAILLTDIFAGLSVLALYLLLLRGDTLSNRERLALMLLLAVSAATHNATLAVLLALLLAAVVHFQFDRRRNRMAGIWRGLIALTLGVAMVFAANYVVAKRLAWTPGGFALSFGRMLQDGIVTKYLDEHCPDPKLQLCAYKDQLPHDADVWFWGSPLFDRLGRFAGLGAEMERIAVASVLAYPGLQAETALIATGKQLIDVRSGEGVVTAIWHTYAIIERYTPQLGPAMRAARQQSDEIDFTAINRLHYPLALIAMALLPVIALLAWRKTIAADIGELAATVTLALLANAFVCGALSNPHDRYGARMVWLAVFACALALAQVLPQARGISPSAR
ncbi:MAG: hypothetical protein HYX37_20500 [Rhizobiales bacterium]|nr:hypothetical protein [Hyphomicrobiales bacterium]